MPRTANFVNEQCSNRAIVKICEQLDIHGHTSSFLIGTVMLIFSKEEWTIGHVYLLEIKGNRFARSRNDIDTIMELMS